MPDAGPFGLDNTIRRTRLPLTAGTLTWPATQTLSRIEIFRACDPRRDMTRYTKPTFLEGRPGKPCFPSQRHAAQRPAGA
jgi:hypothetical protein